MKTISVMIPCYNEEENVVPISEAVVEMFQKELPEYDYEILFIDNCSTDKTRDLLRMICSQNSKIKAILNATLVINFIALKAIPITNIIKTILNNKFKSI